MRLYSLFFASIVCRTWTSLERVFSLLLWILILAAFGM